MSILRRLLPDGLAGRFALLFAAALIAANLVALGLFSIERARLDRAALIDREIERIVSLVPAIETAAADRRAAIAQRSSTRFSRVAIAPKPFAPPNETDSLSVALARNLTEALPGRTVHAGVTTHSDPDGQRTRMSVAMSIELQAPDAQPDQWLNVVSRGGPRRQGVENRVFVIVLGLSLAFVLGVGLLFVRRLTRPLRDLARAAKAAGRGDRTVRVVESGAREMREAAAAFNDMQTRIAQFDADRMRTLAAVGHDLRTPITSLRIRAEMLDDDAATPMIRTLEEMTVMADGLVAFAKGAGDAEQVQPVDLRALLDRLCEERGAAFTPGAKVNTSARVVALGRAIGNLIDNAIRYGGTADVELIQHAGDVTITIDDNGPGISADRMSDVFEPFVRGEESRSPETGGAGLGLSIARNIVVSHGGTVTLRNRSSGGLRATVWLPAASETETKAVY